MLNKKQIRMVKRRIKNIRETRKGNNVHWMKLLEIAIIHAPEETYKVLSGIESADAIIGNEFSELVQDLKRGISE